MTVTGGRVVCVGLATLDLVQRVEDFVRPNEKITSLDADLMVGGPAAGAAVTAAALGSSVTLLTALGRHPLAGVVATDLAEHGVEVVDADPDGERPPPISAVSIRDSTGERSVVSRNAQDHEVEPNVTWEEHVDGADVVLVDGHHPRLAMAVARRARQRGCTVVLDAGSWKPVFEDLLGFVDCAVCSADFRVIGTTTAAEQGMALLHRGVRAVAVTRGADPVLWWHDNGDAGAVPVPQVCAVDTLGAGDVFHGAVVHRIRAVPTLDRLPRVLAFAVEVAAMRVEHSGRRAWLAELNNRDDLLSFS